MGVCAVGAWLVRCMWLGMLANKTSYKTTIAYTTQHEHEPLDASFDIFHARFGRAHASRIDAAFSKHNLDKFRHDPASCDACLTEEPPSSESQQS